MLTIEFHFCGFMSLVIDNPVNGYNIHLLQLDKNFFSLKIKEKKYKMLSHQSGYHNEIYTSSEAYSALFKNTTHATVL